MSDGPHDELVVSKEKFFQRIGYRPHPRQWEFHLSRARFRVAVAGRRFGKALDVATPILTYGGWKTMGTLVPGDVVFDEQGVPCNVVGATRVQWDRPCYRLKFSDGSEIIADAEHEWFTWDKAARKIWSEPSRKARPSIKTTADIARSVMAGKERNHAVQLCQPLQHEEKKYLIDPYVLGVWLGDGTSNHTCSALITCHDDDVGTMWHVEQAGYAVTKYTTKYVWGVRGLITDLKQLGLWGNKHVPDEYFIGAADQRLALLQGLMDTDGSVNKQGACDFTNMNEGLVNAVERLAVSLGAKVTRYTRRAVLNGKDCGLAYRANITSTFPLFRLERKVQQQFARGFRRDRGYRFIVSVEPIETVPVRCIEVDSPSHLYLAGTALIPTHNSYMAARDLEPELLVPNRRYWIVAPTYDLGEKEFRVIWNDLIVTQKLGQIKEIRKVYNKQMGKMLIEFPWNTVLEVRSADHPENLVGDSLDGVIMSEAAKHKKETWERYVRPALADRRGWATFPTTPEGFNWVYDMWTLGQSPDPKYADYESWQFPSWENPFVYPGGKADPEIALIKNTSILPWFLQEIGAEFSAFVGKIYDEWRESVHVKQHVFNPAWPNYMAIDPGFTNPLAAVEFQVDPMDRVYVWREHYQSYWTLEQHIDYLKSRPQPAGYRLDMAFSDAADPEAAKVISQRLVGCLALPESKTNWRQGVNLVKKMLMPRGLIPGPEGEWEWEAGMEPSLTVDHSCVNTIREFNNYRAPNVKPDQNVREVAKNYDDHCLDAIRYGLVHIFELGANRSLSEVYSHSESTSQTRAGETESMSLGTRVASEGFFNRKDLDSKTPGGESITLGVKF